LGNLKEQRIPKCCVLRRWTRGGKSAFPPIRKSSMYDYTDSLQKYRELCNIGHSASFVASRSTEAYELLRGALQEAAMTQPTVWTSAATSPGG